MDEIKKQLDDIIKKLFGIEVFSEVSIAPEDTGADFSSNVVMKIAKGLGKNPREIGEEIKREFQEKGEVHVEVAGPGFLNFILPDEYYKKKIVEFSGDEADFLKNISQDEYQGKTVVCEFSDPNPFKVLHIGHFYTSVVGDSISRLFEFSGAKVVRTNFGGDVGLHVGKTLYALSKKENAFSLAEDTEKIAECYIEGTRAYEESEEARKEIVQINKKVYEFSELGEEKVEEFNEEDKKLARLYFVGRRTSYKYFKEFYQRIGVKFDKFYPESEVADRGVQVVESHIPAVYQESDGAIVFKGEDFGLHTRVFINNVGLPTYETKDVGLLFTKNDDYHFDKSVVITGNDIVEYMKVVLKSVEQYAPELVQRTEHITHGNVKLPGAVKMSSRKGNFVKAVDVLDMVSSELQGDKDEKLTLAAIKYMFLKYRIGGDFDFDVKSSVSMTGNSGVYLLYSAVRAKKILSNCSNNLNKSIQDEWKMSEFELKLSKKVIQYREILAQALSERAPHVVCNYLFELAQVFSRFYENCKVSGDKFEFERAKIVYSFLRVVEHGLNILGISVPDEM